MPILSDAGVRRLRFKEAPGKSRQAFDVYDKDEPRLFVRVRPTGAKAWYVRHKGRQAPREKLGDFPAMGVDEARETAQAALKRGPQIGSNDPISSGGSTSDTLSEVSVAAVVAHFREHHVTRRKSLRPDDNRDVRRRLDAIVALWGPRDLASLTVDDVRAHCKAQKGQTAHNHVRGLVRLLWNYGVRNGFVPADRPNPAAAVAPYRPNKRNRCLTAEECGRLLAAIEACPSPYVRAALLVTFELAARPGEMLSLKWADVSSEHLVLRDTKSGKDRRFPLTPRVRAILGELRDRVFTSRDVNTFVFAGRREGKPLRELRRPWAAIVADAGLTDVQPKDLRHARATGWLRQGVPLPAISRALGHSDVRVTMTYLDVADEDLHDVYASPLPAVAG